MKCNDIKKYFYAFLDNELDVERNLDVLSHLNMCPDCGWKIETERIIQKKLKETVCRVHTPAHLEQKILNFIEPQPTPRMRIKKYLLLKKWLIPVVGIATTAILVLCFLLFRGDFKKNDLLYLVELQYHRYLMNQLPTEIHTQKTREISEYLEGKTGMQVVLPGIKTENQFVDAVVTEIEGVKTPLVFYLYEDTPVMLYLVCNTEIDFTKLKKVIADDKIVYTGVGPCGVCQIVGWEDGSNKYFMVSKLNSNKLLTLLTKA